MTGQFKEKSNCLSVMRKEYFPFLCMFLFYAAIHKATFQWMGDDPGNLKDVEQIGLIGMMIKSNGWSSRILVNAVTGMVLYAVSATSLLTFYMIDSWMYVLIMWSVYKIICLKCKDRNLCIPYLVIGIFLIYPVNYMSSAGWISTSVSYIWPIAIGIWGLYKYIESESVKKAFWKYVIYIFAIVYGTNIEGFSVFCFVIFGIVFVIQFMDRRIKIKTFIYTAVSFIGVGWHLFSPGNAGRVSSEIITWFQDYNMLNIIDKIELAFSLMVYKLCIEYNAIFIIFSLFLAILVFKKTKDEFYRCIGGVPMICIMIFMFVPKLNIYNNLSNITTRLYHDGTITVDNYSKFSSYIIVILGIIIFLSIFMSFYVISEDRKAFILLSGLLTAGIGAWMVMIFSPTIWASGERPLTVLYFVLLALDSFFAHSIVYHQYVSSKLINKIVYFFAICSCLNLLV